MEKAVQEQKDKLPRYDEKIGVFQVGSNRSIVINKCLFTAISTVNYFSLATCTFVISILEFIFIATSHKHCAFTLLKKFTIVYQSPKMWILLILKLN